MTTQPNTNKNLGLPYSETGMQKIAVCFDVDGTLVDKDFKVHHEVMDLLFSFAWAKFKNVKKLVIWSGGGKDYAESVMRRVGLSEVIANKITFMGKTEYKQLAEKGYDILAFDDIQDTRLGKLNLIVRNK